MGKKEKMENVLKTQITQEDSYNGNKAKLNLNTTVNDSLFKEQGNLFSPHSSTGANTMDFKSFQTVTNNLKPRTTQHTRFIINNVNE